MLLDADGNDVAARWRLARYLAAARHALPARAVLDRRAPTRSAARRAGASAAPPGRLRQRQRGRGGGERGVLLGSHDACARWEWRGTLYVVIATIIYTFIVAGDHQPRQARAGVPRPPREGRGVPDEASRPPRPPRPRPPASVRRSRTAPSTTRQPAQMPRTLRVEVMRDMNFQGEPPLDLLTMRAVAALRQDDVLGAPPHHLPAGRGDREGGRPRAQMFFLDKGFVVQEAPKKDGLAHGFEEQLAQRFVPASHHPDEGLARGAARTPRTARGRRSTRARAPPRCDFVHAVAQALSNLEAGMAPADSPAVTPAQIRPGSTLPPGTSPRSPPPAFGGDAGDGRRRLVVGGGGGEYGYPGGGAALDADGAARTGGNRVAPATADDSTNSSPSVVAPARGRSIACRRARRRRRRRGRQRSPRTPPPPRAARGGAASACASSCVGAADSQVRSAAVRGGLPV